MQYDFALAANGGQQIDVKGKFFKYISGIGRIRVRINKGGYVDLLPGQGVWNVDFETLNVSDRSGAVNAGTILAGDFDFHDDRITGTVDVVDGGKYRTKAQIAYSSSVRAGNVGAMFATVQLWNPPASGKNIVVEAIGVTSVLGGTIALLAASNSALANLRATPGSKLKQAGVAASVAVTRYEQLAAQGIVTSDLQYAMGANSNVDKKLVEPIVITPGYGLNVSSETANVDIAASFEYYEEPV